jgi:hypothetical protein
MLMPLLICLLVGAALGQRFKVMVLIPAMAVALTASALSAYAGTFWQTLGAALLATSSLQIGYFAGVAIRYLVASARTSRTHVGHLTTSRSPRHAAN